MQYREELVIAVNDMVAEIENNKLDILNKIQLHALNQIRSGYTSFRISKLKKEDEYILKEWADITNASVKVIKFRCFADAKKYVVKQFYIDLRPSIEIDYKREGETLEF